MWASRANCMTSRTVNQKYTFISLIRWLHAIFARKGQLAKGKEAREEVRQDGREEKKATSFSYPIAGVPISCPTQATAHLCVCSTCPVSRWSKIGKKQIWEKKKIFAFHIHAYFRQIVSCLPWTTTTCQLKGFNCKKWSRQLSFAHTKPYHVCFRCKKEEF